MSQDKHPTESIPLIDMNVTMNGQTGHPHGMQITALIRGKTRNYFVYAESGKVRGREQVSLFKRERGNGCMLCSLQC